MAKLKRMVVGSVCKNKDATKPDYISLRSDTAEELSKALMRAAKEKGLFLRLESKKYQQTNLESAIADGKLSPENGAKAKERIEKIPDWVRFEIVLLEEAK